MDEPEVTGDEPAEVYAEVEAPDWPDVSASVTIVSGTTYTGEPDEPRMTVREPRRLGDSRIEFAAQADVDDELAESLGVGRRHVVDLVTEPGTPHDPGAVRIVRYGRQIGYLSTETANAWHQIIAGMLAEGAAAVEVDAMLVRPGRWADFAVVLPGRETWLGLCEKYQVDRDSLTDRFGDQVDWDDEG